MGRRRVGNRAIARISITIGERMELFELERETLIDRKSCVRRAAALYEVALEYINRVEMNSAHHLDLVVPPDGLVTLWPKSFVPSEAPAPTGDGQDHQNPPKHVHWSSIFDENLRRAVNAEFDQSNWAFRESFLNGP
jgi:hypothetical protein